MIISYPGFLKILYLIRYIGNSVVVDIHKNIIIQQLILPKPFFLGINQL